MVSSAVTAYSLLLRSSKYAERKRCSSPPRALRAWPCGPLKVRVNVVMERTFFKVIRQHLLSVLFERPNTPVGCQGN